MNIKSYVFILIIITSCNYRKARNEQYEVIVSNLDSTIILEKYYSNAFLEKSKLFYNERLLEEKHYDENGTVLDYYFYNKDGKVCYYRYYDDKTSEFKTNGEPSYYGDLYVKNNKKQNYYLSSDTLLLLFFAPNPPNCLSEFRNSNNKVLNKLTNFNCVNYGTYYPSESGNYEIKFTMSFFDSSSLNYFKKEMYQTITISP
jgi:hypothetical protein